MNENLNLGPKLDIKKYPVIKCSYCGSVGFKPVIIIKKVPGVLLGQGTEDQYVPLQVYCCNSCNKIWEEDAKSLGLDKENSEIENTEESSKTLFKL